MVSKSGCRIFVIFLSIKRQKSSFRNAVFLWQIGILSYECLMYIHLTSKAELITTKQQRKHSDIWNLCFIYQLWKSSSKYYADWDLLVTEEQCEQKAVDFILFNKGNFSRRKFIQYIKSEGFYLSKFFSFKKKLDEISHCFLLKIYTNN